MMIDLDATEHALVVASLRVHRTQVTDAARDSTRDALYLDHVGKPDEAQACREVAEQFLAGASELSALLQRVVAENVGGRALGR